MAEHRNDTGGAPEGSPEGAECPPQASEGAPRPDEHPTAPAQRDPPADHPRTTIIAIMISVFLMGTGTALQGSAVSLRGGLEGFSDTIIGVIMSANYVGLILGSLLAPTLIRGVGYVRTYAAFASIGSASAIVHVLLIHPVAWVLFRGATGFCLAVMLVVVESWLNASSSTYNRGRILSIYSVVYLGSMGAGQPLLAAFSPATFELFAVTTIIISFCLLPVSLMRVSGNPEMRREPPQLLRTFRRSPLAGSGVVVSGMVTGGTWSLAPRFGQQLGMEESAIGLLMLTVSLGILTLQLPLGWISDRRDRRRAILWSVALATAAGGLIALTRSTGPLLYVLIFLFGGFGMPLYSLSIALANDQLSREEMVRAAGAIVLYYGVGSAAGPVAAGAFMGWIGPAGLFLFMSMMMALLLVFTAVRVAVMPLLPRRRETPYRPYPATTAAAFQLLRRVARRRGSSRS